MNVTTCPARHIHIYCIMWNTLIEDMPHTVSYIYLRMIIHWLKRFTTFQRWLWFCRAVITVAEPTRIKNNYEKLTDKCIGIVWGRFREKTQEPAICGKECNGQGAISIGGQAIRWYFPSIIRIWYQIGRLLNIGNRLQGFLVTTCMHARLFVSVCCQSPLNTSWKSSGNDPMCILSTIT